MDFQIVLASTFLLVGSAAADNLDFSASEFEFKLQPALQHVHAPFSVQVAEEGCNDDFCILDAGGNLFFRAYGSAGKDTHQVGTVLYFNRSPSDGSDPKDMSDLQLACQAILTVALPNAKERQIKGLLRKFFDRSERGLVNLDIEEAHYLLREWHEDQMSCSYNELTPRK